MYPPRKPSCFVPALTPEGETSALDLSLSLPGYEDEGGHAPMAEVLANLGLATCTTQATHLRVVPDPRAKWFTAPETFFIHHQLEPLPPDYQSSDLKMFVKLVDGWMRDWVATGSNPFIHPRLYEAKFPSCLQIAFGTFSAYIHRTAANTEMVLRTTNDQATALISTYEEVTSDFLSDLAVIHALLVYQMIGLFDGDIRSRYLAEERASILAALQDRILQKTSAELVSKVSADELCDLADMSSSPEGRLWRCWIISESIRRTWLIGRSIGAAYEGLKHGWAPCYGHVMVTSREGLWKADSASAWLEMCVARDVLILGRDEAEALFDNPPTEVDEFSKVMLQTRFGKDRFLRWAGSNSTALTD